MLITMMVAIKMTVPEARDRLIQLLSKVIWSFAPAGDAHAVTLYKPGEDSPYTSVIVIPVPEIQAILNPDLSVEELCKLHTHLAITVS